MQIRKYREATKEGIAVKSKVSWHNNERWHRGEIKNIVAQQKKGVAVESKIGCKCSKLKGRMTES